MWHIFKIIFCTEIYWVLKSLLEKKSFSFIRAYENLALIPLNITILNYLTSIHNFLWDKWGKVRK